MSMNTEGPGPLEQVRAGMRVVDADGDEIGTVKEVVMGDPGAQTAVEPPEPLGPAVVGVPVGVPGGGGAVGPVAGVGAIESALPEVERSRLLRAGYVRIGLKGLFSGHRFAAGDEIEAIAGDVVRLAVPSARLVG